MKHLKHIKNISLQTFLLTIILFMITGCSSVRSDTHREERTIIDGLGREVAIPVDCNTIACVDSFASEVMILIGDGEKMCCCPGGVKSDTLLQEIYPNLENVSVVQSGGDINAEALLSLNPDVILFKYGMYLVPEQKEKIEKLGIPYLVTKYETMEEQIDMLRMIGDVCGSSSKEKAEEIALYYENTIQLVNEKTRQIPSNEKVRIYHTLNGVNRTDGDSSLGTSWIAAVGCENVSVGEDLLTEKDMYIASTEQIFVWDPDIVICNDSPTAEFFRSNDMFSGLRAVQDGHIYNIPVGATRWGQQGSVETFFGMLWLGKTVYPELYQDVDLKKEVFNFYENTLGISLNDEIYNKMLSGTGLRVPSGTSKK